MYRQKFISIRDLLILLLAVTLGNSSCSSVRQSGSKIPLFDGRTFNGWEGDTLNTWRIMDGALVGGSLEKKVPHNEFISTVKSFSDYVLKLEFKLTGTEGFINGGVQFHSKRIVKPPFEMTGYQADLGNGYWGSLYDESRRNKILAKADPELIRKVLRPNEWNSYEVRAEGRRIRIFLNGKQTIDYTESDPAIPQSGTIALQVHGGGRTQVFYRNISLQPLHAFQSPEQGLGP